VAASSCAGEVGVEFVDMAGSGHDRGVYLMPGETSASEMNDLNV